MTGAIIDGRQRASLVIDEVTTGTSQLLQQRGIVPGLAVILVGDDPASQTYVSSKSRMARRCGFLSRQFTLPALTSRDQLLSLVAELNADSDIHGILVQLPLPPHLDANVIVQSISPEKDVDGLQMQNAGRVAVGDLAGGLAPCTPQGAMMLIRDIHGEDLSGLNAMVIGRSNLFGRPMALMLIAANATVTVAHSRTRDILELSRLADILVVAVGQAGMVKVDWVKPGATVIDVGINRAVRSVGEAGSSIVGDVDFKQVLEVAGAITPVPGGVGPMTIAMLMANTFKAARRAAKLSVKPAESGPE